VIGRCMQRHRHEEFIRFLNPAFSPRVLLGCWPAGASGHFLWGGLEGIGLRLRMVMPRHRRSMNGLVRG
jgi:hypothetical protein